MLDTFGVGDPAPSPEQLEEFASSSLFAVGRVYTRRSNGDLQFTGTRPGPGWVGHGYFCRWLWVLRCQELVRIRLWKRRWKHPVQGTCHSRPPDEMGRISVCSLVYVLTLFGWLSASCGLEDHEPVFCEFKRVPSRRTLPRWLHRALPQALETQQAFRLAVIQRCEPRPFESLFPGGLSPPAGLLRRRFGDPPTVASLWRAFAMVLCAAVKLRIPAALLLAEARGKEADVKTQVD